MADIVLRVAPEVLQSKAGEIQSALRDIDRRLRSIGIQIKGTGSFWEGDAGRVHQEKYKKLADEAARLMPKIQKHPVNLLQMAGIYKRAEQENLSQAQELPSDTIL